MKIRKWGVEYHPTTNPIPLSIVPLPIPANPDECVPLLKDNKFYARATALIAEHNALVDEIERLRSESV